MSISVNLLQGKRNYTKIQNVFKIVRLLTLGTGVISLSSLLILFLLQRNMQDAIEIKSLRKKQLELEIQQYKNIDEKVQQLQSKVSYIESTSKQQPPYTLYYEILKKHFTHLSSDSGSLKNIKIDRTRVTDVLLTFPDILALSKFLDYAESPDFQEDFESISLGTIALSDTVQRELLVSVNVIFKSEYR